MTNGLLTPEEIQVSMADWERDKYYGKTKDTSSVNYTLKAQREMTLREVTKELDECFGLAPFDDEYLRILVRDCLEYLKTDKRRKERQALKIGKFGG